MTTLSNTEYDECVEYLQSLLKLSGIANSAKLNDRKELWITGILPRVRRALTAELDEPTGMKKSVLVMLFKLMDRSLASAQYSDNLSKKIVLQCLDQLLAAVVKSGKLDGFLNVSSGRQVIAGYFSSKLASPVSLLDAVTLFSWLHSIVKFCTAQHLSSDIVQMYAQLVDFIVCQESPKFLKYVHNRVDSIACMDSKFVDLVFEMTAGAKDPAAAEKVTALFGITALAQVGSLSPERRGFVSNFVRANLLQAKKLVVPFRYIGLARFFASVSETEFVDTLLMDCDKSMLRAPELFIPHLSVIVEHVKFDTGVVLERLHHNLLKQYKSSNATYRTDALKLWQLLSCRTESIEKLNDILCTCLKHIADKTSTIDSKLLAYQSLASFSNIKSVARAEVAVVSLLPVLENESSENLLSAGLAALHSHLCNVSDSYRNEKLVLLISDGIASPKDSTRLCYIKFLSQLELPDSFISDQIIDILLQTATKYSSTSIGNFAIEAFNVAKIIFTLSKIMESSESLNKASVIASDFAVSEKHFSKFSAEAEVLEICKCWNALLESNMMLNGNQISSIMKGFCKLLFHPSHSVYARASKYLNALFTSDDIFKKYDDGLALNLISHLSDYLFQKSFRQLNETLTAEMHQRAEPIAKLLFQFPSTVGETHKTILKERFLESLLVMNHDFLNAKQNMLLWAELVFETKLDIDPAKFLTESRERVLNWLYSETCLLSKSGFRAKYAVTIVALLCRLNPDLYVSLFSDIVTSLLKGISDTHLTEADILIWETAEGVMFHDIINVQAKSSETDRNSKDYEMERWERELKLELERKKQASMKLTREQQVLVKEQLRLEQDIRLKVQKCFEDTVLASDIVEAVLYGGESRVSDVSKQLFDSTILAAGHVNSFASAERMKNCGFDVLGRLFKMFSNVGSALSPLLGNVAERVSVCAFKNAKIQGYPAYFRSMKGQELFGNTLKDLEVVISDHGPATVPAFYFIFHAFELMNDTISEANDLFRVACHIMALHANLGNDPAFPRQKMISLLIRIIAKYPQFSRKGYAILVSLCSAIGESIADSELNVLLDGLKTETNLVRKACLESLELVDVTEACAASFATCIWIECHEEDDEIAAFAQDIWAANEMEIGPSFKDFLVPFLKHSAADVRSNTARALASAMEIHKEHITSTMHYIYVEYEEELKPSTPEYDDYGVLIPESLDKVDLWEARDGLVQGILEATSLLATDDILDCLKFLVLSPGALGDENERVRKLMLSVGHRLISSHIDKNDQILDFLYSYLDSKDAGSDEIHSAVVVLVGTAARYLKSDDARLPAIVDRLIDTLHIPSEMVHLAVSECLAPLIRMDAANLTKYKERLSYMAFKGEKYGLRKGGAFGLAGLLKGYGISGLKDLGILDQIKGCVEDKKSTSAREGALFAITSFSLILGRRFEPYIMQVLPFLLASFGDSAAEVRDATIEATQTISSNLSAYAVKVILPSVIAGLTDYKWRTKVGSIEFLGAMAHLAPKQLSLSLPKIIPKLSEVLMDSHQNVRKASKSALEEFSTVIHNPEIRKLVPVLLQALADPVTDTHNALTSLMKTSFIHYIDSASLALITPIVERGLKERSSETKRQAAGIIGGIASLTEKKDLVPYVQALLPLLREISCDAVPETRAISAQTIGRLVEQLGESTFPTLVSDLCLVLATYDNRVDRQGAAQTLSEIIHGLGEEKLDSMLPEILENTHNERPHAREGYLMLLVYLPATFEEEYVPYLDSTIPHILTNLADEYEFVRETATNAAQIIIHKFAQTSIDCLLPNLEKGFFDNNWRLRESSISLLGDLLQKLSGAKTQVNEAADGEDVEQDEGDFEHGKKAIIHAIGYLKFKQLLGGIYVSRFDSHLGVRQLALQVWKALVMNTPRTLKEILSELMGIIVEGLAQENAGRRESSANVLGDLAQKMGEVIMVEVVPWLTCKFDDRNSDFLLREGACIGLNQLISMCNKDDIASCQDELIRAVKKCLLDPNEQVQRAAAHCFESLYDSVGSKTIEPIVIDLLRHMHGNAAAMNALKQIMVFKGNQIFPVLLPDLLSPPLTGNKASALASFIEVGGTAVVKASSSIFKALVTAIEESTEVITGGLSDCVVSFMKIVSQSDVVHSVLLNINESFKSDNEARKFAACFLLRSFVDSVDISNLSLYIADWFRILLSLFDSRLPGRSKRLVRTSWEAFGALLSKIKKEDLAEYVSPFKKAVSSLVSDLSGRVAVFDSIEAFNLPKGLPFLPVLIHGLLYGNVETRIDSVSSMNIVIKFTETENLRPYIIQMTGPLIRIIGEKNIHQLKEAILGTLKLLLTKVPMLLKPFMPQLQRILVKCLSDSSLSVRQNAAGVLGVFVQHQTSADALLREVEKMFKEAIISADMLMLQESGLVALWKILTSVGEISKAGQMIIESNVFDANLWSSSNEKVRNSSCIVLGTLSSKLKDDDVRKLLIGRLFQNLLSPLSPTGEDCHVKLGALLILNTAFAYNPVLVEIFDRDLLKSILEKLMANPVNSLISEAALQCMGRILLGDPSPIIDGDLCTTLASCINGTQSDLKRIALLLLERVSATKCNISQASRSQLVPAIVACVRDRTIPVKLAAEKALIAIFDMINVGESQLNAYIEHASEEDGRQLQDYNRRVLSKLVKSEITRRQRVDAEQDTVDLWDRPALL